MRYAWRAPACIVASNTARFSTSVTPEGTQTTTRGFGCQRALHARLVDEVAQHRLGDLEVGDDAVLQRPDGDDGARRAAEHALGLDADGQHALGVLLDRDDGRLDEHDAAPADGDERVGGPEVDGHVATAEPGQRLEPAHEETRVYLQRGGARFPSSSLLRGYAGFFWLRGARAGESPPRPSA